MVAEEMVGAQHRSDEAKTAEQVRVTGVNIQFTRTPFACYRRSVLVQSDHPRKDLLKWPRLVKDCVLITTSFAQRPPQMNRLS
jgi:hypothetical protein